VELHNGKRLHKLWFYQNLFRSVALLVLTLIAIFNTFAFVSLFLPGLTSILAPFGSPLTTAFEDAKSVSPLTFPLSWFVVGLAWIWRGRVRLRWKNAGLDSDSFRLILRMKGGPTRLSILKALTAPKDRLELANELSLDWKTVDHHIRVLSEYGFIKATSSYGTVVLYGITKQGETLLKVMDELNRESVSYSRRANQNG
jgi:DNA-binding transcriptional ArsR family regulator